MAKFTRREFLKASAATAAATTLLPGCASQLSAPAKPIGRVVIIGGGYGGATAAKYLRMWGGRSIEVLLIERNTQFVSCPISNLVLAGTRKMEDITRGYNGLREYGVQVLHDEATGIDVAKKRLQLTKLQDISYDRLIVSPGVELMPEQIEGYNADAQKLVLSAWKAGPETVALRRQLEAMPDGGVYVITIPRAPYRCPPGPYERACQVAAYFKRAKPRSKVLILDANEDVISKPGLFKAAWNDLYKGMVEYRGNSEVKAVDAKNMTVKTDFDSIKGDVLNVLPPMRAGEIARRAGLLTGNTRWCGVDWLSMESIAQKGIHVLGDSTLSAPGMPKSGHMANNHAKIAAAAIIELMNGRTPSPDPVINNTCYSFLSDTEAVHVASVHRYDAAQKTLIAVPGTVGVSPARTQAEFGYASAWARNIWSDMLA
jgi:sulfide dehydrogenase [flavocytochrome c] flavoprotein subunit